MEVLQSKYPNTQGLSYSIMDCRFDRPPEKFQMDLMVDTVTEVVRKLSRGNGPVGSDSVRLQH